MSASCCQLYLVTPPILDPHHFITPLSQALDQGGIAYVQLRLKPADLTMIRRACDVLRPVVQERKIAFVVNDHPQIAAQCGCDGVHIGQNDTPYPQARQYVGDQAIVGVTCHDNRQLALSMAQSGVDYVAFGAFFPTTTKPSLYRPSPTLLSWWRTTMTLPCVAIGGITPQNCASLVRNGADFLAVMAAVWRHPSRPSKRSSGL